MCTLYYYFLRGREGELTDALIVEKEVRLAVLA